MPKSLPNMPIRPPVVPIPPVPRPPGNGYFQSPERIDRISAKPYIPKAEKKENNGNYVQTANQDISEKFIAENRSDASIEERLAFMAITGTEILQIVRSYEIDSNSNILNKNILDSVATLNSFNPLSIIKLQNIDLDYFSNFDLSILDHEYSLDKSVGLATISIPNDLISSTNKVQIQTFTPTEVYDDTIY